jgi:outer membrane protein TolC
MFRVSLNALLVCALAAAVQSAAAAAQTAQPGAPAEPPLTLQRALELGRLNSQPIVAAETAAKLAAEDRVQARAAFLPSVNGLGSYIYTQPNGTPSGVFVPSDGPHVYYTFGSIHADLFTPAKWADYRSAAAAEAAAQAKADVATRGLVATIVQDYYTVVAAVHKSVSAQQGLTEAQQFLDITQRQERAGEVAHSDVVKAQIQVAQRQRESQDAELSALKARLGLSVLIFPDFRDTFSVVDDLQSVAPLASLEDLRARAAQNNPDIRAAEAAMQQSEAEISAARSGYLPSVSFDYFYGLQANQFAVYNPDGQRLLGSSFQFVMSVPLWNWGATQSKVTQAHLRSNEAKVELTLAQRTLLANIIAFHAEAQAALSQVDSLKASLDLSAESLRLTLLRYQAGEVTVLEVVDAQTTLIQARNAYDDGLVRYRVATAALQTLTGSL